MGLQRMDKLLSDTGRWSRKEAKELIRKGQVLVNGKTVRKPEEKADPEQAQVTVCGEVVPWQAKCYLLLHKPAGVLTATEDRRQKTVLELLPQPYRKQGVAPVGRLDKDSTGMLLLTDDGQLAHQVIAARGHVAKYYHIVLARPWEDGYLQPLEQGITLADGAQCLPAKAAPVPDTDREALICLHEGKYHQVRRMFAALGNHVSELARVAMGGLLLPPELPLGACCVLSEKDVQKLLKCETDFASLLQTLQSHSS